MKTSHIRKALGLIVCCSVFAFSVAQSKYDGNMLTNAVGKSDQSPEVKNLKDSYTFQIANENHYLSKEGIELVMQNSALNQIKLYKESPVYGSFKGKLPNGLRFGLSPAEVKQLLGKPSVSYNTGYCEFEVGGQVISCWFENDRLSQLDLGLK
jgi:hypothetical protein